MSYRPVLIPLIFLSLLSSCDECVCSGKDKAVIFTGVNTRIVDLSFLYAGVVNPFPSDTVITNELGLDVHLDLVFPENPSECDCKTNYVANDSIAYFRVYFKPTASGNRQEWTEKFIEVTRSRSIQQEIDSFNSSPTGANTTLRFTNKIEPPVNGSFVVEIELYSGEMLSSETNSLVFQ